MAEKKEKVAIVILTWNGLKDTLEVLKDVEKLNTRTVKLLTLVVDNGSTDGTIARLKNYSLKNSEFKLIENGKNLGFAGGNNPGIKYALKHGADYVLLLNNDVILDGKLVMNLVRDMNVFEKAGIICPKMYFAKGYEFHKGRYLPSQKGKVIWYAGGGIDWDNVYSFHRGVDEVDGGQYDAIEKTDFANGACVLVKKEVFGKVGFLDDKFFLYWEDADFSQRAKLAGWDILYTPSTHLWHKVSSATGGSGSPSNDYFLIRNRLIFGFRYARLRTKVALVKDSLRMLVKGRPWQKKGVLDYFSGNWGKGSWGKK